MGLSRYNTIEVRIMVSRLGGNAVDARFMGFDFHVPINQPKGSRTIFDK